MRILSRRALLVWLAGGLLGASSASGQLPAFPALLTGFRRTAAHGRRYRVKAVVSVAGIRIFSRDGVGAGYAAAELGEAPGGSCLALQFAAGSWPERAGGLNRFGILREALAERSGDHAAAFAGFITSTKEESWQDAREALRHSEGGVPVTLAWGHTSGGRTYAQTAHAELPAGAGWAAAEDALEDLLHRSASRPLEELPAAAAGGFLVAMYRAGLAVEHAFRSPFLHNGKLYELRTRRKGEASVELHGEIRNEKGQLTAQFRARYAPGDTSGLPVEFDYQARSFLRLTVYESPEPAAPVPVLLAG